MIRRAWLALLLAALASGCRGGPSGWEASVVVSAEVEHGPASARAEAVFRRPAR